MSVQVKVITTGVIIVALLVAVGAFVYLDPSLARSLAGKGLVLANQVPQSVYELVITSAIGAITVSPVALGVKKWFTNETRQISEQWMILIVALFSFVSAIVAYLVTTPTFAPWIIAIEGFITLGMTQPVYFLFIRPLFIRLGAWFTDQIAKATLRSEARAALLPETGLPAPSPSVTTLK